MKPRFMGCRRAGRAAVVAAGAFALVLASSVSGESQDLKGRGSQDLFLSQASEPSKGGTEEAGAVPEGARLDPERGLWLAPEAAHALGVQFCHVETGTITQELVVEAQVYGLPWEEGEAWGNSLQGYAFATAFVDPEAAKGLRRGQPLRASPQKGPARQGGKENPPQGAGTLLGRVLRIDATVLPALGKVEALFAIQDPQGTLRVGDWLWVRVPTGRKWSGLVVSKSALLQTTQGPFLYIGKGPYLKRVSVEPVCEDGQRVGIRGEIREGDPVVCDGVATLWLLELSLRS